jgi:dihydroflavonol-4-reductase
MRVLVTGSTGFIGGALCRALLEGGYTVRAFHRPTSTLRLLEGLPVEHAEGDLTQPETLVAAMRDVEVVFHAAALLGGVENPARMYAVTVQGTRSLLQAASQAGVRRVVHTSSVAALGVPEGGMHGSPGLLDESHTWNLRPDRWQYGYAKYLAELEVQQAVAKGLDVVIVNPSIVIGAGDIYRQTSSLVLQVAHNRLPALVEGGANFVHLADVVAGHIAALERGRKGERYILGGENLTLQAAVKTIAKVTGGIAPLLVLPGGLLRWMTGALVLFQSFINLPVSASMFHLAGMYFYYDTRKAQVSLGLPAPRPLEEAAAEAYEWFTRTSGS